LANLVHYPFSRQHIFTYLTVVPPLQRSLNFFNAV